ncbi:MAG: hypothetical protein ACHQPI_12730 [Thermoanaerobaculia bacterium]
MASDIFILKANGKFLVRPSTLIHRSNTLKIQNFLDRDVTVSFPSSSGASLTAPKEKGGKAALAVIGFLIPARQTASLTIPKAGVHTIAVHVEGENDFAIGDSAPIVIIDP